MDIIEKIRNLKARAADAASTEAEVQAAIDHAARLMEKHSLTEADILAAKDTTMEPVFWGAGTKGLPEVHHAASAVAAFTETKCWFDRNDDGKATIAYLGMEQDVEMALYLVDLIHHSMNAAWKKYANTAAVKHLNNKGRNMARRSFLRAMIIRIRSRLMDMVSARAAQNITSTGTSLMVMKRDLVLAAQAELGLNLRTVKHRKRTRTVLVDAHEAGKAAGDKTNLTTGIAA